MIAVGRALLAMVCVCGYTELVGYLLHRFLHTGRVAWMTRAHLVHHLELYGPTMKMRTPSYRDRETPGIAGVGWEWIWPSLGLFAIEWLVLALLGVPGVQQLLLFTISSAWSVVMFHGAHEAMHVTHESWYSRWPLRRWFRRARRMHAIHHVAQDEHGQFCRNYGIAFHGFDRLFGSYADRIVSTPVETARTRPSACVRARFAFDRLIRRSR